MIAEEHVQMGAVTEPPIEDEIEDIKVPDKTSIKQKIGELFDNNGELHLRDILKEVRHGGAVNFCNASQGSAEVALAWPERTINGPIQKEERTGKLFAIAQLPATLLSVDESVNPRHLQRGRLEKLSEAFLDRQTRFQLTQCRLLRRGEGVYEVAVFDGSHGTAAEVLAGATSITCKIYLADQLSDEEAFRWNTEAHSALRQQEFRSRVLMSRRAKMFESQFAKFLQNPLTNTFPRSERGFISSLPTYERALEFDSIFDYVYYAVLEDTHEIEYEDATTGELKTMEEPSCKLQKYIRKDEQQKRGGKMLGYDLLKSTILKEFVQQDPSDKVVTKLAKEEWPREQERRNLVRLCNILADETLEHWGETQEVTADGSAVNKPRSRKTKQLTPEAAVSENLWKKGAVRIWSRRLRDAIGLELGLANADLQTIFQRPISQEIWDKIRAAVKSIYNYQAWISDKVVPLLGGNVIGEIEKALDDWADYNKQPHLDAYYLLGRVRP
ncbi:MAG: hypothetical protein AABN95_12830 [Acidobacteriota bacterium]